MMPDSKQAASLLWSGPYETRIALMGSCTLQGIDYSRVLFLTEWRQMLPDADEEKRIY